MNIINTNFTGYRPPNWFENITYFFENTFHTNQLSKLSSISAPAPIVMTDISKLPIFMQGLIPNCVENAVTWAKMYYDWKKTGVVNDLSAWFLFNVSNPSENGTSLRVALEQARTVGIAERKYMPDPNVNIPYNGVPIVANSEALANAQNHRINSYMCSSSPSSINIASLIAQFGIIIVGMDIDSKWWLPSWNALTLPITPPSANSATLSLHCDILYGYNGNIYSVLNSWSDQWANKGTAPISQDYINSIYEVAILSD
jgi:hypothetical protein